MTINNILSYYRAYSILIFFLIESTFIPFFLMGNPYIYLIILVAPLIIYDILYKKFTLDYKIIILFVILCIYFISYINIYTERNLFGYICGIFVCIFSMLILNIDLIGYKKLIKLYIKICFLVSFFGLISFLLVNIFFQDAQYETFSLYTMSGGQITRDSHILGGGYSMPYGLGLILTNSDGLYTLGPLKYFRASGLFHEPHSAALFIVPAIIILLRHKPFSEFFNRLFLVVISIFWLTCSSVASIVSLTLVCLLWILSNKRHLGAVIMLLAFVLLLFNINYIENILIGDPNSEKSNLFSSKANYFFELIKTNNAINFLYTSVFIIFLISSFVMSYLRNSFTGFKITLFIIFIYFIIHSAKGFFFNGLGTGIFIFWSVMLLKNDVFFKRLNFYGN